MTDHLSKKQRRELKRAEEAETREAKAKQKQIKKYIAWGVFVVAIAAGIWGLTRLGGGDGGTAADGGLLAVGENEWIKGNLGASVTLIEYADFQCPACASYAPVVKQLGETFADDVRIVFRHFPLSQHRNAVPAALAAEAAGAQGKFWEMYDLLFANQNDWSSAGLPQDLFPSYAGELGLDVDQFNEDYKNRVGEDHINRDLASASALNLPGTPSFFLDGKKIDAPRSFDAFRALIQSEIDQSPAPESGDEGKTVHEHADFKVVLSGNAIDFTPDKYQATKEHPLDPFLHLHDGNGEMLHKERTSVTLNDFFESIGMNMTRACLTLDTGEKFCNSNTKSLKMIVNGDLRTEFGEYEMQDLDRILVSFGPSDDTDLQSQIDSVKDEACIYSEKCPERGSAPEEECVGGLGTTCGAEGEEHE